YAAVSNQYASPEDEKAGGRIFSQRCAICHGANGEGSHGPSLNQSGLKHGDSDLQLYRVLRDGGAGTPTVSPDLSFGERWQVISFLRTLQTNRTVGDALPSRMDIRVSNEQIQMSDSRPGEWLSYSGSLSGQRYTALAEISPANVSQLRLRWVYQLSTNE